MPISVRSNTGYTLPDTVVPSGPVFFDIADPDVVMLDPNNVLKSVAQVGNTITIELFGGLGIATDLPDVGVSWLIPLRLPTGERVDWAGVPPVRPFDSSFNMFFPTPPTLGTDAWAGSGISDQNSFAGNWIYFGLRGGAVQTDNVRGTNSTGLVTSAAPLSVGVQGGFPLTTNATGGFTSIRAVGAPFDAAELATLIPALNGGKPLGATPWIFLSAGRTSVVAGDTTIVLRLDNFVTSAVSTYLIPAT